MRSIRLFASLLSALAVACSDDPSATSDATTTDSSIGTSADASPDTSGPRCTGTPTPCAALTSNGNLCILTSGCEFEAADCTGTSEPCLLRNSVETCETGIGCFWSSLDSECEGSAAPCSSHKSEPDDCEDIGCNYSAPSCTGTVQSCDHWTTFGAQSCLFQTGCEWQN